MPMTEQVLLIFLKFGVEKFASMVKIEPTDADPSS